MTTSQKLPEDLPRFAESWRIYIDTEHGDRMLISEWMRALAPYRTLRDFCPQLAKAGKLGFICSTLPDPESGPQAYYGDANYPVVYWIWKDGAWALHAGNPDEYCARRGVRRDVFDLPKGVDAPSLR